MIKEKKNHGSLDKLRMAAIIIVSLFVIVTGGFFSFGAFRNGDIMGGILGAIIAMIIISFAVLVFKRGTKDLREGYPLKDERSIKVMEKASSKAFYISLYLLLAVGFLSDDIVSFRDVSQATGITVGIMALFFAGFWAYYNRQEI